MKVYIVGAGPGDPKLLTVRAAELLGSARVVLYDALVSDAILELLPEGCEQIFVGKRAGRFATDQGLIIGRMIEIVRSGTPVIRLKGGDPFVFGRGGEEAQALARVGIPFEIVPGISSALAVPAYAGIPLTHRGYSGGFTVVTGHEDPLKSKAHVDWRGIANTGSTIVLLMALGELRAIAQRLCEHGLPRDHPVALIENGTLPEQRTIEATLETIADRAEVERAVSPAVVVIGDVVRLRREIAWRELLDSQALL